MTETIVDSIYSQHKSLIELLDERGEISLRSDVDSQFRKILLLSAASYFETEIRRHLLEFVTDRSSGDLKLVGLVKAKAIERQYHTYFQWSGKNANTFFALFGREFRERMVAVVNADEDLRDSIQKFLELGNLRNELVHENFANFPLEKTSAEIYELYTRALVFVESLSDHLRQD